MKRNYFFLIIIMFFLFIFNVRAEESKTARAFINSSCNIRTGPGTNYDKLGKSYYGYYYNLLTDVTIKDMNNHKDCNSDWYQVYYNGENAYVCGDHVDVVYSHTTDDIAPVTACEQELSKAGFPSSYWGGLCNLKEKHPTWTFQALATNHDWETVIERESVCGKNYIHKSYKNEDFFDTTCSKTSPGGYIAPSQKAHAFFMDPRNFFGERYIFQFLDQSYDINLESVYTPTVESVMKESEFYKYHLNLNNNLTSYVTSGSKKYEVSPIFIATRIYQELGSGTSLYNLWSGTYNKVFNGSSEEEGKYLDYYNFFNFGVSDSCVAQNGTTYCGLNYAFKNNWKGVETAINGGISQLSNGYIRKNQFTGYLQKFNVLQDDIDKVASHQYQSNIEAPSIESRTSYSAYNKYNLMDINLIFKIPVYKNMNATINNSAGGAVDDSNNTQTPSTIPIHTIVTSSGYNYTSKYISKIELGTEVAELKGSLESVGGNLTVVIYDAKGNIVTDGVMATGYKVEINNQSSKETLEAVVKGDTSGDGKINALDLLQVQKNILGTYKLTGAYMEAGDTSSDGKINAMDLLQVQKNILGTYKIEQK